MTAPALRVRVVVAEDSITARHLLVTVLRDDPAIEVVGEAANGVEAIELIRRLRPSVVVMDIRMPVMDGFEATKRIMIESPTPVVIVTAAADPDVELSLRAVQVGALALLAKPAAPSAPEFPVQAARLVSLVKAFADVKVVRRRRAFDHDAAPAGDAAAPVAATVEIVAIAASTGGPAALYRLLERLPRTSGAPFLVVQHISEGFTAGLVSWLSSGTPLPVKTAEHGERLAPGTIYVAPEHRHLEVTRRRTVALLDQPPVGGFRPSATVLFRSVAAVYGPAATAVVLTGMGRDGFDGVVAVKKAGGRVLAQDEATSVVFGMPGAIVAQGLADLVGPVEVLAERLRAVVSRRIW